MLPLLVAAILCLSSHAVSTEITGTVRESARESTALSVVVHASGGAIVDSSAVAQDGSLLFSRLSKQTDGVFVLEVYGADTYEYTQLLVLLKNGAVASAMPRKDPLLLPPREDAIWPEQTEIVMTPRKKTNYAKKPAPWQLRDLWRLKYRLLQLLAVIFVVWFPQVIRDLPQELREEVLGEKDEDIGDPNALVKALLGRDGSGASVQPQQQT